MASRRCRLRADGVDEARAHRRVNATTQTGAWSPDSKSHVAHMSETTSTAASSRTSSLRYQGIEHAQRCRVVRIEFVGKTEQKSQEQDALQPGEVIDASKMDVAA